MATADGPMSSTWIDVRVRGDFHGEPTSWECGMPSPVDGSVAAWEACAS